MVQGLGIRATARVFEVDPNTVLHWLVEAAEQLRAFSRSFLCEVHVRQVQLDELYAVLRAVQDGELSQDEAIQRLERSPQWVWAAIDPESKLLLALDVGNRTLAMDAAPRPSGRTGGGARLCPVVAHRWLQGVHDRATDALRPVGPACSLAGVRPHAYATLAAPAPTALCASGQDRAAPAPGAGAAPRGVRYAGGCATSAR